MIYTITDFKNGNFYLEKKTTEEHIVTGWATVKITLVGAEYLDSSKVSATFVNFAEMMNYFEDCKTKADEVSEDEEDFEFYDWKDFTHRFWNMTFKYIDEFCEVEETNIHLEIEDLEDKITELKKKEKFYRDYPTYW